MVECGDCREVLPTLPEASFDSVVTDPPYGLEFMGKDWDAPWKFGITKTGYTDAERLPRPSFTSSRNPICRGCGKRQRTWEGGPAACACESPKYDQKSAQEMVRFQEWCEEWATAVYRVLKPGGYMLAMGGTRTYHRLAVAVEDAGFEIRDCLMWVYGTGFPKGQGCLKPAWEPILLCRKPGKKVLPLGIDACRVEGSEDTARPQGRCIRGGKWGGGVESQPSGLVTGGGTGRYPANVLHDGSDEVIEAFAAFGGKGGGFGVNTKGFSGRVMNGGMVGKYGDGEEIGYGDTGTAARFFYAAKSGKNERWVMLKCDCQTRIIPAWEKRDQSRNDPTDITSLARDICEGDSTDDCDSSTSSSGNGRTAHFRPGGKSTTSTRTSKTTGLKTSDPLAPQSINGFIPGANSETASGGSLAPSADSSSPSLPNAGTPRRKAGRSTADADRATLPASSRKSVCERCGSPVVETSHPTVKPLALMRWMVRLVTPEGGRVLDPFAGSGSTLVAATLEGREAFGVELDPAHCDIARRRVREAMGTGLLAGV